MIKRIVISQERCGVDAQLILEHKQPMIFAKKNKGLILDGFELKVVEIGKNNVVEKDILVHDKYNPNPILHTMLIRMRPPYFPVALGVIQRHQRIIYQGISRQIYEAKEASHFSNVQDLQNSGDTWKI